MSEEQVTAPPWTLDQPTADDLGCLPRQTSGGRSCQEGYLYVVEFSFGTVKPGQTTNARQRMRQHLADGVKFGGYINRLWVSRAHPQFRSNEDELLIACREVAKPSTWTEYFTDLDYESVVAYASQLPMGHESGSTSVFPESEYDAFDEWSRSVGALAFVIPQTQGAAS